MTNVCFDRAEPLKEAGGDQNRRRQEENHTSLHRPARHRVTNTTTRLKLPVNFIAACIQWLTAFRLSPRDFSPALFNSVPILPGSSASTQLTPQISSDSNTANSMGLRPSHEPSTTSPNKTTEDNKDRWEKWKMHTVHTD